MSQDPLHDFQLLIRSRYGALLVETTEEDRAEALAERAAWQLQLPLFVWRRATGLRRAGAPTGVYGTEDPRTALGHVVSSQLPALYVFHGLGPELERPDVADLLREAARQLAGRSGAIVLTGANVRLPGSLRVEVGPLHLPMPTRDEYESLQQRVVKDVSTRMGVQVSLAPADQDRLLANLQGLTLAEAEKLLTRVLVEDGRLDAGDVKRIVEAKRELVERDGLLEFQPAVHSLDDIADLVHLKEWLEKRRLFMEDRQRAADFGLEFPRGVLLVGVPGCGKSLCAKAVAAAWGLPLVRLDPGALYDKYIGETEQNFRRAMASADRLAPLVLWIDEIEKAFAAGGEDADGGTSLRVLGSFLSWLQERRGDVFVVATANDVQRLPAELLRKGRFDETFFVDLPDEETRAVILDIHLRRRKQAPDRFDLRLLAAESEGYSGAELEQVVISALYTAFSAKVAPTTALLLDELRRTPPIASTAREKIAFLRAWAEGRTVPAN
ncbi:MAG TPA: AAA family ATPase [Thermoleophilia bacterium]|nr:AAA family ATPase [Thermoleophilia bacterium]